jgi:arsenite/tail-anchored protein-transporting ATPase
VGGKGGVGKSTAASALAVSLARGGEGRRILLLGVDPAGSLGDVLGVEVGAEASAVPGVPGLEVRQLEAESAWREFQSRYRAETEELFAGLVGGSMEADQRVVERLMDLAPPGIDELMTLVQVVDLTEDRPYDALVLDTAPTGHLLRLLELPAVALEWTHAVLRMLLKYREVMGLGGVAERVLELSRDLRALRELLADPRSTWFLGVALPEALSVPETRRLLAGVRAVGIQPAALLVNRVSEGTGAEVEALLALDPSLPAAAAPDLAEPPVGVEALADFAASWRELRRS